jgi:acetate kinase
MFMDALKGILVESPELIAFLQKNVELFKDFPKDKLIQLIDGSKLITFESNEAVLEFGEEGRFLGVLLSGQAEATVTENTGRKKRISVLGPGSIFGEMSLMTGNQTIASIVGITRCETLLIPQHLFSTILITHPPAIRYLSRTITKRSTEWATMHNLAAEALQKSDDPYGLKLSTESPAKILIINCGSSSLKYALFDTADESKVVRGSVERIGSENIKHVCRVAGKDITVPQPDGSSHRESFQAMVKALRIKEIGGDHGAQDIAAVGHRVVHGGDKLNTPVIITKEVIEAIENAASLAPLHNPINLIGIREAQLLFPQIPHVAVFDTGFHHTMPPYAYM